MCISSIAKDENCICVSLNSQKLEGLMPYRRLPTTDQARLRALNAALKKLSQINVKVGPLAKDSIEQLHSVKSQFENALKHYELNIKQQSENNVNYKATQDTARMYLSHFIQVLFFASERGEINGGIKFFGKLQELEGKLPSLNSEQEILDWGQIIVNGEQNRVRQGGSAIYSPSIALVKFKLEEFRDAAMFQQNLKRNTLRAFEKMQQLRKTTNDFIARLWTDIENHLSMEARSEDEKRQLAEEFGIVYVLRRKERKLLAAKEKLEGENETVSEEDNELVDFEAEFEQVEAELEDIDLDMQMQETAANSVEVKPEPVASEPVKAESEIVDKKLNPKQEPVKTEKPKVVQQDLFFNFN
jgi:hypothetical protein